MAQKIAHVCYVGRRIHLPSNTIPLAEAITGMGCREVHKESRYISKTEIPAKASVNACFQIVDQFTFSSTYTYGCVMICGSVKTEDVPAGN
jgi:hypothetical protein